MPAKSPFPRRLAAQMKKTGFSVSELVRRSEIPRQQIHEYLGGTIPRGDTVARLAVALGCSTDALLMEAANNAGNATA